jgi:hypothetical protein
MFDWLGEEALYEKALFFKGLEKVMGAGEKG